MFRPSFVSISVLFTGIAGWRGILVAILLTAGLSSAAPAAENGGDRCADVIAAELNAVRDVYREAGRENDYFRLDLPSPGTLVLEVSDLAPSFVEARLELVGADCRELEASAAVYAERSLSRAVLRLRRASTYVLEVRTAFAERSGWYRTLIGFEAAGPLDEVDEWEEDDISQPSSLECGLVPADDHGDSAACATGITVHSEVPARLERTDASDLDYFSFVLTKPGTLIVETRGETDTYGQLLDASGHRLAADDDSGSGSNFRIVETLRPGHYVVKVEGTGGSSGAYRLVTSSGT